jgi:transaldolase
MANALEQLKQFTTVVADTGDFGAIAKFKPQDSTTNPSLLYQASQLPDYQHLVTDAIAYGKSKSSDVDQQVAHALDKLAVNFGIEILKVVPGRVSTEIDARLSFDTEATYKKAKEIIQLYKDAGIDTEKRILVKIASTWEGLQAAKRLEAEGIHVNMTLLFSIWQAAVAAENGVTLISPFAGRITDFYKARDKVSGYEPAKDPGVISIKNIYNYYKKHGYKTVVMGASFRTKEQIIELAGCDLLTISPQLLDELAKSDAVVEKKLDASAASIEGVPNKLEISHSRFLYELNDDEMAHFKLAEGIRKFAQDTVKLEDEIKKKL